MGYVYFLFKPMLIVLFDVIVFNCEDGSTDLALMQIDVEVSSKSRLCGERLKLFGDRSKFIRTTKRSKLPRRRKISDLLRESSLKEFQDF
ncbi:uncharacterized protein LOC108193572 isoform X3 [Daucus carota subsp. sativus]|uniref:uncharacterized protein LOC108193572 isoform X3 n=1 Tax=Daucus carota subsp. sativus TaxID=79200 RepID=UPI003082BE85